ncbi:MAG: hypothetical protein WCK63_01180 [Betaproteobacteria bacterium]
MIKTSLALVFLLLTFGAKAEQPDFELQLGKSVTNKHLSSGSGMVAHNDRFYVVGDDTPYLFEIDSAFKIREKTLIKSYPVDAHGRIAKTIKPDFEAMVQFPYQGMRWNLIVGSGSKEGDRELGFMLSADNTFRYEQNLSRLYRQLYVLGGLSGKQRLNIEGLALAGETLYFFNRGNSAGNMIFSVPLSEIIDLMMGNRERVEHLQRVDVKLPVVKGFEAGFSGADFWPQADALIYTASIETTGDAYGDGEILGSFIGLIRRDALSDGAFLDLRNSAKKLTRKHKAIKTKVESVALTEVGQRTSHGALVSDNDDGSSEFFKFTLRLKR